MNRVPHPHLAVLGFAREVLGRPFVWGETNCIALGLRAIDVQVGTSLLAKYRKLFATERRANAWMAKHSVADVAALLKADGLTVLAPAFAQPGDLIFTSAEGVIGCAVLLGQNLLSSTSAGGVALYHPSQLAEPQIAVGVR